MYTELKVSCRINNQVTITKQNVTKFSEKRYSPIGVSKLSHSEIDRLILRKAELDGLDTYYDRGSRRRRVIKSSSPLDLTSQFQHKIVRAEKEKKTSMRGYGDKPNISYFTHRSGQKVRECGAAVDILCRNDPSKCRVITLTLPSSGDAAYDCISRYSSYAINRVMQIIRRSTENEELYWFYVWEYQKRGALHLHICLFHEDGEISKELGERLVSKWRDVLRDISGKSGVNLLFSKGFNREVELCDMQSINQEMYYGCGAYFSKYASKTAGGKGSLGTAENVEYSRLCRLYPVSRFWGSSQNLKRVIRGNSILFKMEDVREVEIEEQIEELLSVLNKGKIVKVENFQFKKEIEIDGVKATICEGDSMVFYVSPSDYQIFLNFMRQSRGDRKSSAVTGYGKRFTPSLQQRGAPVFSSYF